MNAINNIANGILDNAIVFTLANDKNLESLQKTMLITKISNVETRIAEMSKVFIKHSGIKNSLHLKTELKKIFNDPEEVETINRVVKNISDWS